MDFALTSQTRIASARPSRYRSRTGDVAEWLKATVCYIVVPCKGYRGFESLRLRHSPICRLDPKRRLFAKAAIAASGAAAAARPG